MKDSILDEINRVQQQMAGTMKIMQSIQPLYAIAEKIQRNMPLYAPTMAAFSNQAMYSNLAQINQIMSTKQQLSFVTAQLNTIKQMPKILSWVEQIMSLRLPYDSNIDEDEQSLSVGSFMKFYFHSLYNAKWFPMTMLDSKLTELKDIVNILSEEKSADNRTEILDGLILNYYTNEKIQSMIDLWQNNNYSGCHIRIISEAADDYLHGKYALTVIALATMWEQIIINIAKRIDDISMPEGHVHGQRLKETFKEILQSCYYDDICSKYYNEFIMYQCFSPDELKEDTPGRNSIAHGWYKEYPSQKAALNAILFTDFLLGIEPNDVVEN